jgi:SecD/SecF fusion protein
MADKRFDPRRKRRGSPKRVPITLLVVLVLLLAGSVYMFWPPQDKINQGLDIQGGLQVVLTATNSDGSQPSSDDMETTISIIEDRVNALGVSEATVQLQGDDQILVQIPGVDDPDTALSTIGTVGYLEFVSVPDITDEDVQTEIDDGEVGMTLDSSTYSSIITGSNITKVSVTRESDTSSYYEVDVTLDSAGTSAFATATSTLATNNDRIAIVLDGVVQSAPTVESSISDGNVAITGSYSLEDAQSLQTILESGSLPVTLTYAQSQIVGPTIGQTQLIAGVLAAICGLILVALYLLFFYRGLGILTAGAIGVFAALYLGLLGVLSYYGLFSLSLAGIAGIVLTIGVAADSSILILERFHEEIRLGRSIKASSISGVKHAIKTSIDADLVTLISAIALFFIATGSVKGFGLTLGLGIFCDIATMLLFKAPIIRLLAPKVMSHHPGFWGLKDDLTEARANGEVERSADNG